MFVMLNKGDTTIVIPEGRLVNVFQNATRININYDGGEVTFLESSGDSVAPKIETVSKDYDSTEDALAIMRKFYTALKNGDKVFCF